MLYNFWTGINAARVVTYACLALVFMLPHLENSVTRAEVLVVSGLLKGQGANMKSTKHTIILTQVISCMWLNELQGLFTSQNLDNTTLVQCSSLEYTIRVGPKNCF